MAQQIQLEFAWPDVNPPSPLVEEAPPISHDEISLSAAAFDELAFPHLKGLRFPRPSPEAIESGVFGMEEDGPIVPGEQQVALLVREQAAEWLCNILEMDAVDDGIRRGVDPRTGKMPKTEARRTKLREFLLKEQLRLRSVHDSALVAYADAFGRQNARDLDEHLHTWVFGRHTRGAQYSPGHPWFYLPQGDGRAPIPLDEIQPNPLLVSGFNEKLPRQPVKREQRLRSLLQSELAGLEADKLRYQEIVLLGAEASSDYDRTIAYSNDEEARAGSLALKYNHICHRLSRILWLQEQLEQDAPEEGD